MYILSSSNVEAACIPDTAKGIYCKDGLPFYIFSTTSSTAKTLNLNWADDSGQEFIAGGMSYFNIKLNGAQAFCVDPGDPYGYGVRYRVKTRIESNFVRRVYAWGSNGNQEIAQLIIWAMQKKGFFNQAYYYRGGEWGYNKIDANLLDTDTWGWSSKGEKYFIKNFGPTLKAGGAQGLSQTYDSKWFLPSDGYCGCLEKTSNQINNISSTVKDCQQFYNATFDSSDCKTFNGKERCAVSFEIKDEDGNTFTASFVSANLTDRNIAACKKIAKAGTTEEKYAAYEEAFFHAGVPGEYTSGMSNLVDSEIAAIYKEIMNTEPVAHLAVYEAVEEDYTNEKPQRILSATPEDLPTAGCSNILYLLKKMGNVSEADLQKLEQATHVTLVRDGDEILCRSKGDECRQQKKTKTVIGYKKTGFNPKFGNVIVPIYGGTTETGNNNELKCPCETELPKFKSKYNGVCADFKAQVEKWGDTVYECVDGDHATCKEDHDTSTTCEGLLPSYSGPGKTKAQFEEFKRKITDPDTAAFEESTGTISCNKCEPKADTARCVCNAEFKLNTYFKLSDAVDSGNEPKETCYYNGTGYKLSSDGYVAGSLDNSLSGRYCDVYCWESVGVNMPGTPAPRDLPIIAGTTFFWGLGTSSTGLFAILETERKCHTTPKYDVFVSDWNTNESSIVSTFNDYNNLNNFVNSNGYDTESCDLTADCLDLDSGDPGTACCVKNGKCTTTPQASCSGSRGSWNDSFGSRAASCKSCPSGYSADGTGCKKTGTKYKRTASGITAETSCYDGAQSDPESLVDDLKRGERDSKYSELRSLIANRKTMMSNIEACQSTTRVNEGTLYTYTAEMEFETDSTINLSNYGVVNTKLVGNLQSAEVSTSAAATATKSVNCTADSSIGNSLYFDIRNDVQNPCNSSYTQTISDYSAKGFDWNYTGTYGFNYSEDFHFYALKENSHLVNNTNPDYKPAEYIFNRELYYDAEYGFPTRFDLYKTTFNINVKISGLGSNGHFDNVMKDADTKEKYSCDFESYGCPAYVHNPLYRNECDSDDPPECCETKTCGGSGGGPGGGLDIVYRLIDMASGNTKRIFPSIDGDGRNPGTNWSTFISNEATKYKNITTYDVIYDSTPMYTIKLTPTAIGQIRSSNTSLREAGKDPYTSYYDKDNKPKITCKYDLSEKTCVSNYITELIGRKIISGKYAIPVESQRINALYGYKSCYNVANPHNC